MSTFDLTYVTIDSLSEGVGSSQILPLIQRLSKHGLRLHLITYEKTQPSIEIEGLLVRCGVKWTALPFSPGGLTQAISRLNELTYAIGATQFIHARSDIPAVAALRSNSAGVLWDVRSLWSDQRFYLEESSLKRKVIKASRILEWYASKNSVAMSTLTHSVVPVLESRYRNVPRLRTVVPTFVDLDRFKTSGALPKKMTGLYSGTFNGYYDLDLSQRFGIELGKILDVEFHWARPRESQRHKLQVGETKIFESSQNDMAKIIGSYSFGVSICKMNAGPSLKAAMPTKIAEFLASGRPVVVNKGLGDFDKYLKDFNAGIILTGEPGDTLAKAQQLVSLLSDPQLPSRCRELAETYFDIDRGVTSYLKLYTEAQG
jgi:glycosyltransferase involved in cell wall biosynthesis